MKLPKGLSLKPAIISDEYIAKFQIRNNDLLQLYKDDVLISETYYRIGGLSYSNTNYFVLLKQVESVYPQDIIESSKEFAKKRGYEYDANPNYLDNINVIIDNNGNELFQADKYESIYLLGGQIAIITGMHKSKLINIVTKGIYTNSYYKYFNSKEYIFVENGNSFGKEVETIVPYTCVIQINKSNGNYIIYK